MVSPPNGTATLPLDLPIPLWIFLSMESFGALSGNILLCVLFVTNKKLQTNQNMFIISLSSSDILVGFTIAPCEYYRVCLHDPSCYPFTLCGFIRVLSVVASVVNLLVISLDRYISIQHSFHYKRLITKRRTWFIIIFAWCGAVVLAFPKFLAWILKADVDEPMIQKALVIYSMVVYGFILLSGVLLVFFHLTVARTVKTKMRVDSSRLCGSSVRTDSVRQRYPRGLKVCVLSCGLFFLCWVPSCVVELLLYFQGASCSVTTMNILMDGAYFVLLLSPCLNPYLFAFYKTDFQNCLRALCTRMKAKLPLITDD